MSESEDAFKIIQLESDLATARSQVSMLCNILEQIKIAVEEEDLEEIRELVS